MNDDNEDVSREKQMMMELRTFHRQRKGHPVASTQTHKRIRALSVDTQENPFCSERRLADEYELYNYNKNPCYYTYTLPDAAIRHHENPRNHSSFINQSSDLKASCGYSPRLRAEFTSSAPAPYYEPLQFNRPKVISVDTAGLRQTTAVSKEDFKHPLRKQRSKTQSISFGHRPQSASRLFNPSTQDIKGQETAKVQRRSSTPCRTGMSVMELRKLLQPSSGNGLLRGSNNESDVSQMSRSNCSSTKYLASIAAKELPQELKDKEKEYNNSMFFPPRISRTQRFGPPEESTQELIIKYRKLSVGKMPGEDDFRY